MFRVTQKTLFPLKKAVVSRDMQLPFATSLGLNSSLFSYFQSAINARSLGTGKFPDGKLAAALASKYTISK